MSIYKALIYRHTGHSLHFLSDWQGLNSAYLFHSQVHQLSPSRSLPYHPIYQIILIFPSFMFDTMFDRIPYNQPLQQFSLCINIQTQSDILFHQYSINPSKLGTLSIYLSQKLTFILIANNRYTSHKHQLSSEVTPFSPESHYNQHSNFAQTSIIIQLNSIRLGTYYHYCRYNNIPLPKYHNLSCIIILPIANTIIN